MRRLTTLSLVPVAAVAIGISLSSGGCPGTSVGAPGTGSFNVAPTPIITADRTVGVVPLTVQFSSDQSTDDGLIVSREWNFGDGSPHSPEIAPKHTFTQTGT